MNGLERIRLDPRVTIRISGAPDQAGTCVVYWMQRSQRELDNPALDVAIDIGNALSKPVVVFLAPVPFYPRANLRHYRFLADGISDIAEGMARRNVGFILRTYPDHRLARFCEEVHPAIVIGDENPMREPADWRVGASKQLKIPFWTVDADVIVPSQLLAKEQYAARTIRPRLRQLLPQFLISKKAVRAHVIWRKPRNLQSLQPGDDFTKAWQLDRSVAPVNGRRGGTQQGLRALARFVDSRLRRYSQDRNHPELPGTSELSPYLHFGHLGPLTIAQAVQASTVSEPAKRAFLEQLIVRRELAINFVKFNEHYDSFACLEPWANRSFARHASDHRPILYQEAELEAAETHDPLWNAAQQQMVLTGWMHNYLRMYWAKKILEWSPSPAVAYQRAVHLNDRYELDGRDPNGYAGIAWAIVGKHDRPWFDRPIFGQIRYMSYAGAAKKFDSERYIQNMKRLED
jgi:deoxyribodipyrimidine photo-lyase